HLSYPLSKSEYRSKYQNTSQDYYGNGYAAQHGYTAVDSQWNTMPHKQPKSPPEMDFTYYLQNLLQIPGMLDFEYHRQQQQQQQQQEHHHHHYRRNSITSSLQDVATMSGRHDHGRPPGGYNNKSVMFAQPLATLADVAPMSSANPVGLLSCMPYKSSMRVTLSPHQQQQQLGYLAEYDHYRSNNHHEHCSESEYTSSEFCDHYSHHIQQNQNLSQQWASSCRSQCHDAQQPIVRRRKSTDYGAAGAEGGGGSRLPGKQYGYDDRFSLSMEHLPLYHQAQQPSSL
ncbi:hypothetical protein IWW38_004045, partial [Coemansia aciculifera]